MAFDGAAPIEAPGATRDQVDGATVVEGINPGTNIAVKINKPGARPVTLLVLTAEQARQVSIGQLAGQRRLVLSAQQNWFAEGGLELSAAGDPAFRFAVYPPLAATPKSASKLTMTADGVFQAFEAVLPARSIKATVTPLREARPVRPVMIGGLAKAAIQPTPESFANAAAWNIDFPRQAKQDALIEFDFVGDIGRLFSGTRMLDDWYYSGYRWQYATKHAGKGPLTLTVLPLRADAPIYLPKEGRPDFGGKAQLAQLRGVTITPVYKLSVRP